MTTKEPTHIEEDTTTKLRYAISVRGVSREAWKEFKKQAIINDLSLCQYLEKLIWKECDNEKTSRD